MFILVGRDVRPFLIWSVIMAFGSENDRLQAVPQTGKYLTTHTKLLCNRQTTGNSLNWSPLLFDNTTDNTCSQHQCPNRIRVL